MTNRPRNDDLPLMALVARKYYLGGLSKSEIADQLYLSRFKVARLLDAARARGVVEFSIKLPGDIHLNLAEELCSAYQMRRAVVIDDSGGRENELLMRLGTAAATLLADTIVDGDIVGVASTRSLMGIEDLPLSIPSSTFVQLTGAHPRSDAMDVISTIRTLTRHSRGEARVFYAPMVASSPAAQANYLAQPETRAAFDLHQKMSVIVTGVGTWQNGLSLIHDALPKHLQDEARSQGAVAEVIGVPIDTSGRTVRSRARDHIVAPDIEELRRVRDRIAVVADPRRAPAVHTAISTGIINTLVTHRAHAEALLSL